MSAVIVSDTTSLIVLEKLGELNLLCRLFERVLIPEVVLSEMAAGSPDIAKRLEGSTCFDVEVVNDSSRLDTLSLLLDAGEAHAIELAVSQQLPLIIDERKGRQIAQQMGVKVTGFAGLLILAVRRQVVNHQEALDLLEQAVAGEMRLSNALLKQVKEQLNAGR